MSGKSKFDITAGQMAGQLEGMPDRIEDFATEEEYQDFCDNVAELQVIIKQIRFRERKKENNGN